MIRILLMDAEELSSVLVRRIFLAHVVLIAVTAALVMVGVRVDLGVFWFAFLAGVFGASVALLRRVQKGDAALAQVTLHSWPATLMPFLYGGLMAGVTYFLFMSQILSGKDGNGLLATNLFPDFSPIAMDGGRLALKDWLQLRPKDLPDAGKLIVWCFLAGYSESFVSGILLRLQKNAGDE